ncbi:MAG: metallophosphoesterase [Lentisphaeria bacterium]|nr:metallophosphoesterase [Lentisphaeria bacterium]
MDRRTFTRGIAGTVGLAGLSNGVLPLLCQGGDMRKDTHSAKTIVSEGFEGEIPDFHTYQATYAADSGKAHTGKRSLRVTPTPGKGSGGAYFRLDGLLSPEKDYEFSAWVYAGAIGTARLYISASDGKRRYTKGQASGGKAGEWVKLTGTVRGKKGHNTDHDVMLAMTCTGESCFDDVVLRETHLPTPPIEAYPLVLKSLRGQADKHATTLRPGSKLVLDAQAGALAFGFECFEAQTPVDTSVLLPPDGLLVFAVDAPRAMAVTGSLVLEPDGDLRPGLRATVLCDSTVIGTPMVAAAPWQGVGNALTGPAPECFGTRPPDKVQLVKWLMPEGRHYLFVAAPHFRGGGTFRRLELHASAAPVRTPSHQFALLSDTHLGSGRSIWMNAKLNEPSCAQLATSLASLRDEGMAYAFLAGDMTDGATREQFEALRKACRDVGLPIYGCIGNHDAYHASSRPDVLELCPDLFPGGRTDYVLNKEHLRFIVLDGSHWKSKDGTFVDHYDRGNYGGIGVKPEQVQWLRDTLAADKQTPTVFIWHYPLHNRGGISSCGYKLRKLNMGSDVLAALEKAPNVVAALCGHTHWNEANVRGEQRHLINPAFCEWPNAYRVFRVYDDHIEWELRQVANRGFVRESFVVPKASSWMISTAPGDLTGEISL